MSDARTCIRRVGTRNHQVFTRAIGDPTGNLCHQKLRQGRLAIGPQDAILPHNGISNLGQASEECEHDSPGACATVRHKNLLTGFSHDCMLYMYSKQ
jgi:hypothetical protein